MEILQYFLDSLTPMTIVLALVGVILGTVIGAIPGLSATMAVAVLVPFTFTMDPASGLIMLGAIYTGAIYGGSFAAILVNTPGTPSSIATAFDGFPMAQCGEGGLALSLATFSSVVGGIVGGLALLFFAPSLAEIALLFGPAEYFWLAVFGLTLISALSVGNSLKGLIGACLGLLMSVVGVAVVGGDIRYTMGLQSFLGGIDVTSALIGLYCIPVLIDLVAQKTPHLKVKNKDDGLRIKDAFEIIKASKLNLFRSSIIGTIVGILPGAGGSIAGLVSYTEAKRASPRSDNFGKGEPDGIIATEAANNATVGGGFIPTLVLGIPGTPPDAIILGALLVQGVKIGPTLFNSDGHIVYQFIFGLLIATIIMLPVGLLIGRYAYKTIIALPKAMLIPSVAFMTVAGSFAIHSNIQDTQVMVVLGCLGWVLNRFGFTASPIVLGLILGKTAEQGFVQTYLIGNAVGDLSGMFFMRPISMGIIIASILALLYPYFRQWKSTEKEEAPTEQRSQGRIDFGTIAISLIFLIIACGAFYQTAEMSEVGSIFPSSISLILVILLLILMARSFFKCDGGSSQVSPVVKDPTLKEEVKRRVLFVFIFCGWVFLIAPLGFLTTSILAFILLIMISEHENTTIKTYLVRCGVAVLFTGFLWWLMEHALLLRMPSGIFI